MATLSTQDMTLDGLAAVYSAAAGGGDSFTPGDDVFLHVKNGSGAPITVTVVTPNTAAGGLAISDAVASVAAGGEEFFGPFPAQHFAGADGLADITYSDVTTLTVAVVRATRR